MNIMSHLVIKPIIDDTFFSFFHNLSSKKEEIRGPYGECGQKSIIESNHNGRIDYFMHKDTRLPSRKDLKIIINLIFFLFFLFSIAISGLLYDDFLTLHI